MNYSEFYILELILFVLNWSNQMSSIKVICFSTLLLLTNNALASTTQDTSSLSYDALLSSYQYDFKVNYFNIESQKQSLKMAYIYLKPTKSDMPTVTLMHGKNFNADYWTTTAQYLQSLGYGVLIPDQIGFGKSSKPTNYHRSNFFVGIFLRLLAFLKIRFYRKNLYLCNQHTAGSFQAQ